MTDPVIVIGAGVAGCVAARTVTERGHDVVVIEAGPGPERPAELDTPDHLAASAVTDWWFDDLPLRGRGSGGGSAVNGMVLDSIDPIDVRRWGWNDGTDHQPWVLDRWPHTTVPPDPFTEAFGRCVTRGFPVGPATASSGSTGWRPLSLAIAGGRRVSAADAFLGDDIHVRYRCEARSIDGTTVLLADGSRLVGRHVVLAAGVVGSPRILATSGLVDAANVPAPLNHPSTALVVELEPRLRSDIPEEGRAPSSHLLRAVTGLSENTVDLQMLVLGHTGHDQAGRRHGAVIVSALEPDRQKVLIAGVTQALRWLAEVDGVVKVSISDDPTPVQHQACTLTDIVLPTQDVTVVDSSVLPALPHTNPMLSIAVGARRAVLAVL